MRTIIIIITLCMICLAIYVGYSIKQDCQIPLLPDCGEEELGFGEVNYATSTTGTLILEDPVTLKTQAGTLKAITITEAAAASGDVTFYAATTTNLLMRNRSSQATSSITLLTLPNELAAGTYEFNIGFANGLVVDNANLLGTSTIIWQ